jgi:opine dehydrogenase
MKVAVLGSGNGGCAVAFDFAAHGHEVSLFDFERFPENVRAIHDNGGVSAEGELSGFAPVAYAGHDVARATDGAEMVFVVGPAYSTKPFAVECRSYLTRGQAVVVCPSSCGGSIEFKNGAGLSIRDESVIVAETSTLPYAVRTTEPGRINVFLKLRGGLLLAAVPARKTQSVLERVRDVYPVMEAAENILRTSLQNGNPVIHPAVTLLNAALIERTQGDFFFYEEGVTRAVGRLMEAIDQERIAIGRKLGVDITPDPELGRQQGYMQVADYESGYAAAPGFRGIKAQKTLDNRYFHEDVGYGLVFMKDLADQLGVGAPHMSALIRLASVVMQRDYLGEARRTMHSLGLSGYTVEQLQNLLA